MGPLNAFTVDVEDWYQVSDFDAVIPREAWPDQVDRLEHNTDRMLALLDEAGVTATFFVLAWNAERHPDLIRRIAAAGHEIASHGYAHHVIYEQTPETFREDVMRSKAILEDLIGGAILGYRAPSLSITAACLWAPEIVLECGFRYESSVLPVADEKRALPSSPRFPHVIARQDGEELLEFPMSTVRLLGRVNLPLGGGAYLRLLPYAYLRWGMRHLNRRGHPTVTYIHPWEIDPDQPRVETAGRRGFSTHYVGLGRTEHRVRRLLRDFRFGPCRDVLGLAA
jgi:polysaccharide deacetylase family protein (PEP-CTERM system associated)